MIATLQSLRFVFVLLIFLSHFAYGDISALDAGGDCGVAFFFILSGFVLSLGYGGRLREGSFSYVCYLKRRLLKIYPLHLLCLGAFLLASGSIADGRLVLNAMLMQSWVPSPDYYFSYNSVSWFLSSILFCYLVFPLAYRRATPWWLAVVLSLYVVLFIVVPDDKVNAILYVNPLVRFVDFYIGIVLCRLYERRGVPRWSGWQWTEIAVVVAVMAALAAYPWVGAKLRNAPLFWLVLVPALWVFAQQQGAVSRLLQMRPVMFLGSLSMPFYLTHQMLIGILERHLPQMPSIVMLFVCIFVTLMVSWLIKIIFSQLFRLEV
ncbi:MAG: acyltransferase [Prevotella sp.]|nr:acyltransferase [Prevotella sp.]